MLFCKCGNMSLSYYDTKSPCHYYVTTITVSPGEREEDRVEDERAANKSPPAWSPRLHVGLEVILVGAHLVEVKNYLFKWIYLQRSFTTKYLREMSNILACMVVIELTTNWCYTELIIRSMDMKAASLSDSFLLLACSMKEISSFFTLEETGFTVSTCSTVHYGTLQ